MWTWIIQLILMTDMARHFDYVKEVGALLDGGGLDMSKQEHRMLILEGLLKVADISNVSRPFNLADKWCSVLCEEFFRQGDLEKAGGMEFTSPNNDREHLDKAKSQIGFYQFVCLPLYQLMARAQPALQVNADQVLSNMNVWKERAESKPADAEPAKGDEEK
jgi:hypothetical protein